MGWSSGKTFNFDLYCKQLVHLKNKKLYVTSCISIRSWNGYIYSSPFIDGRVLNIMTHIKLYN